MWKMGACIALSAAMMLTSVGGMLPSDWGIDTVYADETQTTTKTFAANQLTKALQVALMELPVNQGKKVGMLC